MTFCRPPFPSLVHFLQRLTAAALFVLALTGCGETSRMRGELQALNEQRMQVENDIRAFDQHIEYYRRTIPNAMTIVGGTDPGYQELAANQARLEAELAAVKTSMANNNAILSILREESSREHKLEVTQ